MARELVWDRPDQIEERVGSVLGVARSRRTAVPLEELGALLPEGGPRSSTEVADWFLRHPLHGRVEGRYAVPSGAPGLPSGLDERRARGRAFLEEAHRLVAGPLARVRGLSRFVGVTGSTAYGEPEAGDDLDFLVITRRGSLWVYLAFTYLALRLASRRAGAAPPPCFNLAMDEDEARRQYLGGRGFLFAREALMTQAVVGEPYYRGLLGASPWIRAELPRLYGRWEGAGFPPALEEDGAPFGVRALNALLFPWLAAYLHLAGLVRNHRIRREGRREGEFRTVTRPGHLAYESKRFDALSRWYETGVPAPETP